ncbi:hypothetical protein PSQ19_10810 [Devosia algicola]|uniref:Xylose isomerase-like TIM barrel domain-containing protein n=1 Tax=Devosia algicola TaxID=3026418 RepID=A0ABY7YJF1_9HYPH|nr:hypothetical protein [Devosia algicola]WDR01322.1 hypothetical protein PSQ19_10810 [Devosia algicola]
MTRQVSVSTAAYDGYSMDVAIAEIATTGAKWIEPAFISGYVAFDESIFCEQEGTRLASRLAASEVEALAVSAHTDLGADGAAVALRRRIDFCVAVGSSILITNSSDCHHPTQCVANIEAVLPVLEQAGIVLALENPGHGTDSLLPDGACICRITRKNRLAICEGQLRYRQRIHLQQ